MNTGTKTTAPAERVLRRIIAEYAEMPGLRVTREQAQRLWGLDAQSCVLALETLVEARFLYQTPSGQYARLTEGPAVFPLRMARAAIGRRKAGRLAV